MQRQKGQQANMLRYALWGAVGALAVNLALKYKTLIDLYIATNGHERLLAALSLYGITLVLSFASTLALATLQRMYNAIFIIAATILAVGLVATVPIIQQIKTLNIDELASLYFTSALVMIGAIILAWMLALLDTIIARMTHAQGTQENTINKLIN